MASVPEHLARKEAEQGEPAYAVRGLRWPSVSASRAEQLEVLRSIFEPKYAGFSLFDRMAQLGFEIRCAAEYRWYKTLLAEQEEPTPEIPRSQPSPALGMTSWHVEMNRQAMERENLKLLRQQRKQKEEFLAGLREIFATRSDVTPAQDVESESRRKPLNYEWARNVYCDYKDDYMDRKGERPGIVPNNAFLDHLKDQYSHMWRSIPTFKLDREDWEREGLFWPPTCDNE